MSIYSGDFIQTMRSLNSYLFHYRIKTHLFRDTPLQVRIWYLLGSDPEVQEIPAYWLVRGMMSVKDATVYDILLLPNDFNLSVCFLYFFCFLFLTPTKVRTMQYEINSCTSEFKCKTSPMKSLLFMRTFVVRHFLVNQNDWKIALVQLGFILCVGYYALFLFPIPAYKLPSHLTLSLSLSQNLIWSERQRSLELPLLFKVEQWWWCTQVVVVLDWATVYLRNAAGFAVIAAQSVVFCSVIHLYVDSVIRFVIWYMKMDNYSSKHALGNHIQFIDWFLRVSPAYVSRFDSELGTHVIKPTACFFEAVLSCLRSFYASHLATTMVL